MRGGTLIMIGTFSIVVGVVSPISVLCIASGAACLYFGIEALYREMQEVKPEEDKE